MGWERRGNNLYYHRKERVGAGKIDLRWARRDRPSSFTFQESSTVLERLTKVERLESNKGEGAFELAVDLVHLVTEAKLLTAEVVTVANPDEAIHLAHTERFSLYILDNWMEGLSGIELCRRLREFDSVTPILFFSGAARDQEKQNAFDCGAQTYLANPSNPDTLIAEIRKLIRGEVQTAHGQ